MKATAVVSQHRPWLAAAVSLITHPYREAAKIAPGSARWMTVIAGAVWDAILFKQWLLLNTELLAAGGVVVFHPASVTCALGRGRDKVPSKNMFT